jgi:hypothetical protein
VWLNRISSSSLRATVSMASGLLPVAPVGRRRRPHPLSFLDANGGTGNSPGLKPRARCGLA